MMVKALTTIIKAFGLYPASRFSLKISQNLSKSLKIFLVSAFIVSMGYSVVVPIEVPPDIPDSLLFDLTKLSKRKDIMERLRHIALKEINKAFSRGIRDVQPILVRKGKPIEPPPDSSYSPNFVCVRKSLRTCIGGGWTPAEESLINAHLSRVLPIIEDIYGKAFMTFKFLGIGNPFVKIIKDDDVPAGKGITCAPWYNAVCFVITGEFGCTLWPWDDNGYIVINPGTFSSEEDKALLTHELFHAFRLNWILTYPQFEEGHAEAGTIIATKELCRLYGEGCSYISSNYINYEPFVFYQYYNLPFMGTNLWWAMFYAAGYKPLMGYRYLTWAYTWIKTYIKNSNVFRNINDGLCSYPSNFFRLSPYGSYVNLLASPAFGSGLIEGENFISWFYKQPSMFNNYPTILDDNNLGKNISIIPKDVTSFAARLKVLYYFRHPLFGEIPEEYKVLRLLIWNYDGGIIKDTLLITDSLGTAEFEIFSHEQNKGRVKIEVCDTAYCKFIGDIPPVFAEIILGFPLSLSYDIIGAVGAEKNIPIHIGSFTTIDTNGYFRTPSFGFSSHEIYVGYVSDFLGSMESIWVKDSLPQWVYPGLYNALPIRRNLRIPPAKPQNLRIHSIDTLIDSVIIKWQPNREADLRRYKIYKSMDYSPFIPTGSTYDTIFIDKLSPCVSVRYFITAVDMFGNEGEPSDTLEITYSEDSIPCLYSAYGNSISAYQNTGKALKFSSSKPQKIEIYDVSGRIIFSGVVVGYKEIGLKRGIYFVKFGNELKKEVVR